MYVKRKMGSGTSGEGRVSNIAQFHIDQLLTAERTALLTKLRDEVEGLGRVDTEVKTGHQIVETANGALLYRDEVLALLEKAVKK